VTSVEQNVRRLRPRADAHEALYSEAERAWLKAVGMAVRLGRARHRWSQTELAERSGIGRTTISYIERGYVASPVTCRRLAQALGMTLGEIFEWAEGVVGRRGGEHHDGRGQRLAGTQEIRLCRLVGRRHMIDDSAGHDDASSSTPTGSSAASRSASNAPMDSSTSSTPVTSRTPGC
jgi:transcriptional regulator with XRE-family HTH domain